ncbi:hypothetical protein IFR05_017156, partial [Cadophora sp. M221]
PGLPCLLIPKIQEILEEFPDLQFQQDNAKGHAAAFTREVCKAAGIEPIFWPLNSADLNPIETIWDEMKDHLGRNTLTFINHMYDYEL